MMRLSIIDTIVLGVLVMIGAMGLWIMIENMIEELCDDESSS